LCLQEKAWVPRVSTLTPQVIIISIAIINVIIDKLFIYFLFIMNKLIVQESTTEK